MSLTIARVPRRVLIVLPPDFLAPELHRRQRIPPQGPAVVAASITQDGFSSYAVDLEALVFHRPLAADPSALVDDAAVERHLRGEADARIDAALDELVGRIADTGCDVVAFSLDRGTQVLVTLLLAVELKRRWGKPIIIGGVAMQHLQALSERTGAVGPDIVTDATTPPQIRDAFQALRSVPQGRRGPPVNPVQGVTRLGRQPKSKDLPDDLWPMPDFGVYDLDLYRRDPVAADLGAGRAYDGSVGRRLVLPYNFTYECQFSCSFCQTDGKNQAKPIADVVRELATMAERWDVGEFIFFDAQINVQAPELGRALREARVDLRWSDSYRVRPRAPGDLELMARGGCASITVGVESASDRVLRKMVKGHRSEHASELVREAHQNEIMLRVNLLPCFPGETRDDFAATVDWVREHAHAIDDIAPSSFYLTDDSPIGRDPERFGIRIRDRRSLRGITKFRKVLHALAFDEVDGMTWEEREPTLEASEDALRTAWLAGNPRHVAAGFGPATMLALRRRFATKAEAYEAMGRWHADRATDEARAPELRGGDGRLAEPSPRAAGPLQPRIVAPAPLAAAAAKRFAEALGSAAGDLSAQLRAGSSAHALVLADGAFVIFRGSVTRTGSVATSARVEQVLAWRAADARTATAVGAFVRGAAITIARGTLRWGPEAAQEAPLQQGVDFDVVTFALGDAMASESASR